ncbi:MAG: DNA polymerase III subunit delta' [Gemmatimonadota bacterium]|nr:DNA polymerase III subunit delta' [Gemmatimonadota bacterium]
MFDQAVVGQKRVTERLERMAGSANLPHALLFTGPEGTGKAAAALEMARSLYCDRGIAGCCERCRGCRKTAGLNHPDLSLLFPFSQRSSPETERETLVRIAADPYGYPLPADHATHSIGQIRALQKQFAYGAFEGGWRVAVILHADQMRAEAANALLKTLEEPPARSLLILTASAQDSLLPTIVSRCQWAVFSPVSVGDTARMLSNEHGIDDDAATSIARTCGGNLRRAREMVDHEVDGLHDRGYRFLSALLWDEEARIHAALEKVAANRDEALQLLGGAEIWLRDALLLHYGDPGSVTLAGRIDEIRRLSRALGLESVTRTAEKIESLREMNRRNVNLYVGLVSLWREVRSVADQQSSGG